MLDDIVSQRSARRRRRPSRWIAAAAVAASVALAAGVLVVARSDAVDATPLLAAIDRTVDLDAGLIEIEESRHNGGEAEVAHVSIRHRGDDQEITVTWDQPSVNPVGAGSPTSGSGEFTPELLEFRTIDGASYSRVVAENVEFADGSWHPVTIEGTPRYESYDDQLAAIVESADELDTCDGDGTAGVTTYCLTTTDEQVGRFMPFLISNGAATIRIAIDDQTGLLATLHVVVSDAHVGNPDVGFDGPTYKQIESRWRYQPIDDGWTPTVPYVAD